MIARGRAYAERAAAVGRVGARVCRELVVGVGVRDVVRGTVTGVDAERLVVRIDDAGRLDHTFDGSVLKKGAIVNDALNSWVPCL